MLMGCGRSGPFDGPGSDGTTGTGTTPGSQQQPLELTGRYVFGPMVGKGFAGTPGRLADLEVTADGKFDMMFGSGCVLQGASGTWAAGATTARFDLSRPNHQAGWTDDEGRMLDVGSLVVTPQPGSVLVASGLRIEGSTGTTLFTQFWERVK